MQHLLNLSSPPTNSLLKVCKIDFVVTDTVVAECCVKIEGTVFRNV